MQSEVLRVDVNVDIRKNSTQNVGVTLMSQDINNYSFYLRVLQDGELLEMDESYEVEVLSVFTTSKSRLLTKGTIKSQYVDWVFDPSYISKSEVVKNYVYVRKNGVLLVSADANCFIFSVGLSAIDSDVGRVAEVYDENYEKVLLDYSGALDERTTERLDEAVLDFNQRGDAEIADWREGADSELEDYLADRVVLKNLIANGDFSDGTSSWSITGTHRIVDGKMYVTPTARNGGIRQEVAVQSEARAGDEYYFRAEINRDNTRIPLYLNDGMVQGVASDSLSGVISGIHTISDNHTNISLRLQDNNISDWTETSVDNIMTFNLTKEFGTGNEPTKEWMDRLIEQTGYFDEHILDENWQVGEMLRLDDTKANKMVINNLVTNGDFSQGTTGWTSSEPITVDSGVLQHQSISTSGTQSVRQKISSSNLAGHQLYVSTKSKRHSDDTTEVRVYTFNGVVVSSPTIITGGKGVWHNVSTIITPPSGGSELLLYMRSTNINSGVLIEYDDILVINLTATFGAGNEPTKEQMDRLIEQTGYFDEHILDESWLVGEISHLNVTKANKVQEAWITPTLLNGWTTPTKIDYYKDNFGVVRIRGRITGGSSSASAFALPIGYRPSVPVQFLVVANNAVGYFMVEASGAARLFDGSNTNVNLDTVSFKGER